MAHPCKTKAVFGPIPSRRLGRSLGIDLLPFKTCSIDCVYCECGATTNLTLERREYYPTEKVPQEIDAILSTGVKADYATFSGVGEPTLHTGLGRIIEHLRTNWKGVKTCLLTNSTFLGDPQLQKELEHLDLIVPSIDGSCEEEFQKINRPCPGLTLRQIVDACLSFRKACPHVTMWLEIFIIPGVNDSPESLARFCDIVKQLAPIKYSSILWIGPVQSPGSKFPPGTAWKRSPRGSVRPESRPKSSPVRGRHASGPPGMRKHTTTVFLRHCRNRPAVRMRSRAGCRSMPHTSQHICAEWKKQGLSPEGKRLAESYTTKQKDEYNVRNH